MTVDRAIELLKFFYGVTKNEEYLQIAKLLESLQAGSAVLKNALEAYGSYIPDCGADMCEIAIAGPQYMGDGHCRHSETCHYWHALNEMRKAALASTTAGDELLTRVRNAEDEVNRLHNLGFEVAEKVVEINNELRKLRGWKARAKEFMQGQVIAIGTGRTMDGTEGNVYYCNACGAYWEEAGTEHHDKDCDYAELTVKSEPERCEDNG